MSLRLEMLQVARLSPRVLGESADLVADFVRGQMNADGGFGNRGRVSDLYYSVFGIESLFALRAPIPYRRIANYLLQFREVASLDLVHTCCLARCWANLPPADRSDAPRNALIDRIGGFRTSDGGFATLAGSAHGTLYGCFLAAAGYGDAGAEIPEPLRMLECLAALKAADGGYTNQRDLPMGLTPSTAAAITLLRHLGQAVPTELGQWMLARCSREGGFFATPEAPIPDLLSTATALHALAGMHVDLEPIREPCLDFIDSLWTSQGSFFGNWTDDQIDTEYTYYGLLALGHLSV